MIQYPVHSISKDNDVLLIVPLFSSADFPFTGVPGSALTITLVSVAGVVPIPIGPTAVWTELSGGYYTLALDGSTYFGAIGVHQVNVNYSGAVPVVYVIEVVPVGVDDSTYYDVIRDAQGLPVPDVIVSVYEHGTTNLVYTTKTYADGQYTIPVSAIAPVYLVDIEFTPTGQPTFRRDGVWLG
jgi:5-hydroxyisourate hydrolase-like protein (transthyretin family)